MLIHPRDDAIVVRERGETMIEGLKLTMTGEEVRERLEERIKRHERRAKWYEAEAKRQPTGAEDECILPEHMCEHEQEKHEWRAEVLSYIRDHIERGEVYRLGEADLAFGEILPEAPGAVEQEEYERTTGVAFQLERLTKEVRRLTSMGYAWIEQNDASLDPEESASEDSCDLDALTK